MSEDLLDIVFVWPPVRANFGTNTVSSQTRKWVSLFQSVIA
ncbi:hypothetical protein [Pseudorhizobium flavum]|nr:hypothetical protein [Pseudorhizobium flavum]